MSQHQAADTSAIAEYRQAKICDNDGDAGGEGRTQLLADVVLIGHVDLGRQWNDRQAGQALQIMHF